MAATSDRESINVLQPVPIRVAVPRMVALGRDGKVLRVHQPACHHALHPRGRASIRLHGVERCRCDVVIPTTIRLRSAASLDLPAGHEQAEQLFSNLKRRSVKTAMLRFPGESHELSRSGTPVHRKQRFDHIIKWHKNNLIENGLELKQLNLMKKFI